MIIIILNTIMEDMPSLATFTYLVAYPTYLPI
jgi:hypothetical protein